VVLDVLAGAHRKWGRPSDRKVAADGAVVWAMLREIKGNSLKAVRDRALLSFGMVSCLRCYKITALEVSDLDGAGLAGDGRWAPALPNRNAFRQAYGRVPYQVSSPWLVSLVSRGYSEGLGTAGAIRFSVRGQWERSRHMQASITRGLGTAGQDADERFSITAFMKAFIAEMVSRGSIAVMPHHPGDRRGFSSVVRTLDNLLLETERAGDRVFTKDLVRIVNGLRPGNSGSFEGFETALRAQQLTFARCPNPDYDSIEFPIPTNFAKAAVEELPPKQRMVVRAAVDSFLESKSATG